MKTKTPQPFLSSSLKTALAGVLLTTGLFGQSAPGDGKGIFAEIPGLPKQGSSSSAPSFIPSGVTPAWTDPEFAASTGPIDRDDPGLDAAVLNQRFPGMGETGLYPKDATIATGPAHIVTAVNASVRIQLKSGAVLSESFAGAFFQPLGNTNGRDFYEPWALFDAFSNRFLLHFSSRTTGGTTFASSYSFLAISKTDDPTRGWYLVSTDMSRNGATYNGCYAGQAQISTDAKAVYIVTNMFRFSDGLFQYSKIRVFQDKAALIGGSQKLPTWDLWNIKYYGSVMNAANLVACKMQSDLALNPAAYFCGSVQGAGSHIYLWALTKSSNQTTGPVLHSTKVSVSSYEPATSIAQSGTAIRASNRTPQLVNAVYQARSIWTAHSVKRTTAAVDHAAIRWYELGIGTWPNAGVVSVVQESTKFSGGFDFAYPTLALNRAGDLAMIFVSGYPSQFLNLRVAIRRHMDPPNTMHNSVSLKSGTGPSVHMVGGINQFGRHFGCDDGPDGEIFFIGEYPESGNRSVTYIGSVFPGAIVSPLGYDNKEGETSATLFGYRNMRAQLVDTTWAGMGPQSLVGLSFRLDYRSHTTATAMGRFWNSVVKMTETDRLVLSKNFANNQSTNTTTVFTGKLSLASAIGHPSTQPAAFDRMVIPFNQQWVYSGAATHGMTADFTLTGGVLNNGGTWGSSRIAYDLDAPTQVSAALGTVTKIGALCQDSNMAVGGYCHPAIQVTAAETGDTAAQNRVHAYLQGHTKMGGTAFYALGGIDIPGGAPLSAALCNPLWIDPAIVFPVSPSPASGYHVLSLGALPFQAAYVGARLYGQAGWADSTTGALRLSQAASVAVPAQPVSPTLFATYASLATTTDGLIPSSASSRNPIRRYER